MEYQNLDIVFNSKGEVAYLNIPPSINQYANNYKLRVGITSELIDVKLVTANIKTVNILPTRLLMISADENDFINANNVIIKNVYTYTFSQHDTKAFQEFISITVNIQTRDDTVFNHTVSIPMIKGSYSSEVPKIINDDGTLSNFIDGVYSNLNNVTNRLNILEDIVDPESTTKNPEVIEKLETGISENKVEITSLKNRAIQHETDILTANSMISNLDLNTVKKTGDSLTGDLNSEATIAAKYFHSEGDQIYEGYFGSLDTSDSDYNGDYAVYGARGIQLHKENVIDGDINLDYNKLRQIGNIQQIFVSNTDKEPEKKFSIADLPVNSAGHGAFLVSVRNGSTYMSERNAGQCLYLLSLFRRKIGNNYTYYSTIAPIVEPVQKDSSGKPVPRVDLYWSAPLGYSEDYANSFVVTCGSTVGNSCSISIIPLIC